MALFFVLFLVNYLSLGRCKSKRREGEGMSSTRAVAELGGTRDEEDLVTVSVKYLMKETPAALFLPIFFRKHESAAAVITEVFL